MSILLQNVWKSYGKTVALKGIDLEVKPGEIYGFIGPNGAGKTTTIRILLGILKRDEGKATVLGKDAWSDAVDVHKHIAYVPGDVNLWPNLTGGEVIDFFGRLRGSINQEVKEELIKKFDLDPTKKCRTYSKGNKQKVALITALAADVDIYILDEPTSGLDPLMEQVFQERILELKQKGKTIFLSSHILSEVEKLCDRISIIKEGKIVRTGTLDELRFLTRTYVTVKTKKPMHDLPKQPGIYEVESQDLEYKFQVDYDAFSKIFKYISDFDVIKLDTTPPKLEELFMQHYEKSGDA